ncbi:MAG: thiamine phosphate synthase [Desulfuromonas sp.]|nr:MAG: thiamine phosphate synthase [Desulfuromonas sp.]
MSKVDFNLYLITDRLNLPKGKNLFSQVEAALRGGVRAVQLREKDLQSEELLPLAMRMRELTDRYGARLIINSCLETAQAAGADGIHLPSSNPPVSRAKKILGANRLIGVSTHTIDEIILAEKQGADFVTFGPVYPTPSKAGYGQPPGLEKLKQACAEAQIPVFGLGGITPEKVAELRMSGCQHYACIGAIGFADNPEAVVKEFDLKQ